MTTNKSITIEIPAKQYQDEDDCLAAAAADYIREHEGLEGWDLEPRWADDASRTIILLTVPAWAVAGLVETTAGLYECPDCGHKPGEIHAEDCPQQRDGDDYCTRVATID